jgi:hypothetical protein
MLSNHGSRALVRKSGYHKPVYIHLDHVIGLYKYFKSNLYHPMDFYASPTLQLVSTLLPGLVLQAACL